MSDSNGMKSDSHDSDYVVRLRGLPWSTTEDELKKFFSNCEILATHFTYNREGRPSGEAYVEFKSQEDFDKGLEKNNEHLGNRYVEVFPSKKSECDWVVKRSSHNTPAGQDHEAVVRMRGLPWAITKEEIAQFFSGLDIVPNGILLPVDLMGRATGEAFVQFVDRDTAERAMEKHQKNIGHRYIEVFRSSQEEVRQTMWHLNNGLASPTAGGGRGGMGGRRSTPYDRAMPAYRGMGGGGYGSPYGGGPRGGMGGGYGNPYGMSGMGRPAPLMRGHRQPGHFVHMRGLPFRATEKDIRDFFEPLQVASVAFGFDYSGRPNGEADVDFFTHNDAVEAMKRDRETMHSRYVELFLNSTAADKHMMGGGGMGVRDFAKDDFY